MQNVLISGPVNRSMSFFRVPLSAAQFGLVPRSIWSAARQCSVTRSAALSGRHENCTHFQGVTWRPTVAHEIRSLCSKPASFFICVSFILCPSIEVAQKPLNHRGEPGGGFFIHRDCLVLVELKTVVICRVGSRGINVVGHQQYDRAESSVCRQVRCRPSP